MLADFKADLLVSQVRIDPNSAIFQRLVHFFDIWGLFVGDIEQ